MRLIETTKISSQEYMMAKSFDTIIQQTFTCSKPTIKALEKGVKSVH